MVHSLWTIHDLNYGNGQAEERALSWSFVNWTSSESSESSESQRCAPRSIKRRAYHDRCKLKFHLSIWSTSLALHLIVYHTICLANEFGVFDEYYSFCTIVWTVQRDTPITLAIIQMFKQSTWWHQMRFLTRFVHYSIRLVWRMINDGPPNAPTISAACSKLVNRNGGPKTTVEWPYSVA